jgi:glycerophosphoryl diester phosphodiesterase
MPEPVALISGGHRCRLKWHRGRRHATDIAFNPDRIAQGLAAGAAVEIDLNPLACGGWAVLHDDTLDRETTGTGPVAAITTDALRALRLRDNDGRPTDLPVATLAALAEALATAEITPGGHLQLDLKVGIEALTDTNVAGFARSVAPVAAHMILSGGDAAAVLRLAERSGVGIGYDPCHEAEMIDLVRSRDFDGFTARAIAAMPEARIVYLHRGLVAFADSCGADLIAPFRARGQEVDVYTIPDASAANLAEVRRLIALRADQITTDDPDALAKALHPLEG